jgi:hypothetical protein
VAVSERRTNDEKLGESRFKVIQNSGIYTKLAELNFNSQSEPADPNTNRHTAANQIDPRVFIL